MILPSILIPCGICGSFFLPISRGLNKIKSRNGLDEKTYTVDADAKALVQEVSLVIWMENYHNATYVVMIDRTLSPTPSIPKKLEWNEREKRVWKKSLWKLKCPKVGYEGDRKEARDRWRRDPPPPPPIPRLKKNYNIFIWILKIEVHTLSRIHLCPTHPVPLQSYVTESRSIYQLWLVVFESRSIYQ